MNKEFHNAGYSGSRLCAWMRPELRRKSRKVSSARTCRTSGFTLIELLAVIVIIAVLVALTIPSISAVMRSAKSAKCMSNLRQISVGIIGYASDHGGVYPLLWTQSAAEDPDGLNVQSWVQRVIPYMGQNTKGDRTVWVCPEAKLPVSKDSESWAYTYAVHGWIVPAYNAPSAPNYRPQLRTFSISEPGSVIMVADAPQNPDNNNIPDLAIWRPLLLFQAIPRKQLDDPIPASDCEGMGGLSFHHLHDSCNAIMADGSSRSFKRGEMKKRDYAAQIVD